MFSATSIWADNQVTEWCGELIDSGHETIIGLARRFGLQLDDFAGNPSLRDTYKLFGRYYTVEQAYEDWRSIQPALAKDLEAAGKSTTYDKFTPEGQKLDQMSVAAWIDSRVPGGRKSSIGALLDVAYAIEYGADTTDQSALNLVYLLGANKQTEAGAGIQRLRRLGRALSYPRRQPAAPGADRQASPQPGATGNAPDVDRPQQRRDLCARLRRPPSVTADLVILSLPFAVLRKIDTSGAGFDTRKNTAIQELGRGQSGKLQLQFSSRYWRGRARGRGAATACPIPTKATRTRGRSAGGNSARAGFSTTIPAARRPSPRRPQAPFATAADANVQQDAKAFLGGLETVFPGGATKWNGRAASSLPALDPNLGASYSYWRVGQYTSFAGYEKVRQGNMFFAGEHCSLDYQGYMEGGAAEGAARPRRSWRSSRARLDQAH